MKFAGFWVRAIADMVDSLLLDVAAFVFAFLGQKVLAGPYGFQISFVIGRGLFSLLYYSWLTYRFGTTVGKRLLRIYVVSFEGFGPITLRQSILRCCSYLLSYLPFGGGFIMVAFHPQKRGLHDLFADTISIVKPREAL